MNSRSLCGKMVSIRKANVQFIAGHRVGRLGNVEHLHVLVVDGVEVAVAHREPRQRTGFADGLIGLVEHRHVGLAHKIVARRVV